MASLKERIQADLSDAMRNGAFPAWERARESVYAAWTRETDPANLQPRLRPLNRQVAEFLRESPPDDMSDEALGQLLDAVESPWSRREENAIREIFEAEFESPLARSRALVDVVRQLGIEKFGAPQPLPPIQPEEVHLVVWMAIEAEQQAGMTPQPPRQ